MTSLSKHTAGGSLAGYLFQLERALNYLATSESGASVGIESLDDVAVLFPDGRKVLEQDKHYTSKTTPLHDHSKDFWGSLLIWMQSIDSGDIDSKNTEFHLVTNKVLKSGFAFDLLNAGNQKDVRQVVKKMREMRKRVPASASESSEALLAFSDKQLMELLVRIRISDGTCNSSGAELKRRLGNQLHWPEKYSQDIFQGLLGWINDFTLEQLREKKAVWLDRDAFSQRNRELMFKFRDAAFIQETAAALIPIDSNAIEAQRKNLFVAQLEWVGIPQEDEQILEAIEDYLRYGVVATNLTQQGHLAKPDFAAFEDRLIRKWKTSKRTHLPASLSKKEEDRQSAGRALLNEAMSHREMIGGQQTSEAYFTCGAFHRLAEEPAIGWHPDYTVKLVDFKKKRNNES